MNIFNLTKTKGTHFLHNTKVPVNISLTKIPAFLRSPEQILYRNDPLGADDLRLECSGNLRITTAKMQDLLLCFSPKKQRLYKVKLNFLHLKQVRQTHEYVKKTLIKLTQACAATSGCQ